MNDNDIIGINERRLELLATKIFEYADQTNKIFNQLQSLVDETGNYFISDEGTLFRKKLKQQAIHYYTVNQNLLSYANDFIKLKATYGNRIVDISNIMVSEKEN